MSLLYTLLPYTCSPHHDPTSQVLDAQDEAAEARGVSEDWRVFSIDRREQELVSISARVLFNQSFRVV